MSGEKLGQSTYQPTLLLVDRQRRQLSSDGASSPLRSRPSSASSPPSVYGVDPPRMARDGKEWVWFPEGYWAERDVRLLEPVAPRLASSSDLRLFRERLRNGRGPEGFDTTGTPRQWSRMSLEADREAKRSILPPSPYMSEEAQVQSLQRPSGDHFRYKTPSVEVEPFTRTTLSPTAEVPTPGVSSGSPGHSEATSTKSSAFRNWKERLSPSKKNRKVSKSPSWRPGKASQPDQVLPNEKTSEQPGQTEAPRLQRSPSYFMAVPTLREESFASKSTKTWMPHRPMRKTGFRFFGKASWHRKESFSSSESATSSVRKVLMGPTPPATRTGSNHSGPTEGCSNAMLATSFPGGEATRIRTPPVRSDVADGRPRGFFFDVMQPAGQEDVSNTGQPGPWQPETKLRRPTALNKEAKEWWDGIEAPRRTDKAPTLSFTFDIPEHPPSSTMCPAHPRNRSNSMSVCVYHGRRRQEHTTKEVAADAEESARLIVGRDWNSSAS